MSTQQDENVRAIQSDWTTFLFAYHCLKLWLAPTPKTERFRWWLETLVNASRQLHFPQ